MGFGDGCEIKLDLITNRIKSEKSKHSQFQRLRQSGFQLSEFQIYIARDHKVATFVRVRV